MDAQDHVLTAQQLDLMTPDQRSAEFAKRLVTDPSQLPAELRAKIRKTTSQLVRDRLRQG
jgi:hypothetical protein